MNLFTKSRSRSLCSLILLFVLVPQLALADFVVLTDSEEQADADNEMKPGSGRKKVGISFMAFGGSVAILGAAVKFGEDIEGPRYDEDSYNTFNYAMMIGGRALFVIGTILLISGFEASIATNSAYFDCDRDVTRVGVQLSF